MTDDAQSDEQIMLEPFEEWLAKKKKPFDTLPLPTALSQTLKEFYDTRMEADDLHIAMWAAVEWLAELQPDRSMDELQEEMLKRGHAMLDEVLDERGVPRDDAPPAGTAPEGGER